MSKKRDAARAAERQRMKNLERALQVERTGLVALAMAFIREHGEPERLRARVDAMVRAAAANPKTSPGLRDTLVNGQALIEQGLRVEAGRPQKLFEPDVGHVKPAEVLTLADPPEQQLSLDAPADVHAERSTWEERTAAGIVRALELHGPCTDDELHAHYTALAAYPLLTVPSLRARRVALSRTGRVVDSGERRDGLPVWTLIERKALAA